MQVGEASTQHVPGDRAVLPVGVTGMVVGTSKRGTRSGRNATDVRSKATRAARHDRRVMCAVTRPERSARKFGKCVQMRQWRA